MSQLSIDGREPRTFPHPIEEFLASMFTTLLFGQTPSTADKRVGLRVARAALTAAEMEADAAA